MGITENILGVEMLVILNAYFDAFKIQQGWKIKHEIEGLIQFAICCGLGWATGSGILNRVFLILLNLSVFWIQFDYILNWIRGLDWYHLGTNFFDKILKGYHLRYIRLILKASFVLLFILLFVLTDSKP